VGVRGHVIEVGGGFLTHYLEAGRPDAATVVLVHDGSYGASGRATWEPTITTLAERFHVLAPDLVGYGRSSKVIDATRDARTQSIDQIRRWLDAMDVTEASFVGNSFGGTLILYAAMQKAWPVRRAVTICGTGGLYMIAERYRPLREYQGTAEGMRAILERFISSRYAKFDELVRTRFEDSLIPGHMEALAALRRDHPSITPGTDWRAELSEGLRGVNVPVLLIAGGVDALLEPEWPHRMAERLPRAEVIVVDGGRHQPHLDHAAIVDPVLVRFLSS
jgi:pimeloyl-ACP methyl ester carboxylesterase